MNTGGTGALSLPPVSSAFPHFPHSFHNGFHNTFSERDPPITFTSATPTAALMFQFVSHGPQQLRHAKGLLEGLPCPQEFRDLQDILVPGCA